MKGSIVFSSKRVADWTTRYFFATQAENASTAFTSHTRNLFVFKFYTKIGTPDEGLEPATLRLKV